MEIRLHPKAELEFEALNEREREAMKNAMLKLSSLALGLGFPHASKVRAPGGLWELRPRSGRSRWRALYRVYEDAAFVVAIVPEAGIDRRSFRTGVKRAILRLEEMRDV